MRNFKGILALVLGVVLLIPAVSHAASITIDGVDASTKGFICGTGAQSCAVPIGQYGNYDLGGTPMLSSADGSITDTLKFSNFTIKPHSTTFSSGNVTITYNQLYTSGTGGTYSFGDYMGGYFSPTAPIQTSDSITMSGFGTTGVPPVNTFLPTLLSTITSSNFYSKSTPIANAPCTVIAGGCQETLTQTITIHFIGRDTNNVTNSFFMAQVCEEDTDGEIEGEILGCSQTPASNAALQDLFNAELALDIASFCGTAARGLDLAKCVANLSAQYGLITATPPRSLSFSALESDHLATPEPTTWLLLGTGLGALALWKRKRRHI